MLLPTDTAAVAVAIDEFTEGTRDPQWCRALAEHLTGRATSSRPPIVVLCGSTRYRDQFTTANRELTLAGYIVLAPGVFAHHGDHITDTQKTELDALHRAKIDLADQVVVITPRGYVGDSTRAEIDYATATGTPVCWSLDAAIQPGAGL